MSANDIRPAEHAEQRSILQNIDHDLQRHQRRTAVARSLVNPRDRLFYALFLKIGNFYSVLVPKRFRLILEIVVLAKGLFLFSLLAYLHHSFVGTQLDCLNTTKGNWSKEGVLRVQIMPRLSLDKPIPRFYSTLDNTVLFHPCHVEKTLDAKHCERISQEVKEYYDFYSREFESRCQCYRLNLTDFMRETGVASWKKYEYYEYYGPDQSYDPVIFCGFKSGEIVEEGTLLSFYEKYLSTPGNRPREQHIFEYSLEYGLLHLSPEARRKFRVPVKFVTFDPYRERCFGDGFRRFLLKFFLGYDKVLMNTIQRIAETENNLGYMLNVVTRENYKFVPAFGKGSYLLSFLLMFLFTIAISMLLRYCHQQVFFFIVNMLQLMNLNVFFALPIAPLMAVVLSLVGLETIMAEFFNDSSTGFYIILIVWCVDQFDTICCHTLISQKYWLRFFYLYHFVFYAYHYRFKGQFGSLALAASWFMTQHSMLYFFHNYELPAIEAERHNRDNEAYLDEAVQMVVEGIELVQPTVGPIDNGNGVFVFTGERPFINLVRDFIRNFPNSQRAETNAESPDTEQLSADALNMEVSEFPSSQETTSSSVEANLPAADTTSMSVEENSLSVGTISMSEEANSLSVGTTSMSEEANSLLVSTTSMSEEANSLSVGTTSMSEEANLLSVGTTSMSEEANSLSVGTTSMLEEANLLSANTNLFTDEAATVSGEMKSTCTTEFPVETTPGGSQSPNTNHLSSAVRKDLKAPIEITSDSAETYALEFDSSVSQ